MKVEITAPVGSYESLRAALDAGAGSVYFGIGNLNMRSSSAVNFQQEDLANIIRLCRESSAKAYLALNTVIFDDETDEVGSILNTAAAAGIDAVIATDVSVLNRARKLGLNVHMSTQSNITNVEAVEFFSQWADVMVLSREMSLEKVKSLHDKIVERNICGPSGNLVRLEAFAHGALCMAVSGKCYLSLDNLNRSANRGQCAQICRRSYRVTDIEGGTELLIDNKYIMSPRDLCTVGFLDKLIGAGISVLKIEGRGRPPEYVSAVVKVYSEALEAIENNTYSPKAIEEWMKRLEKVYNRGFWEGYYMGKSTGEWTDRHGSSATERREFIGKVTNYFSKLGVAEVKAETGAVYPDTLITITGPTTGLYEGKIEELHLDKGKAAMAPQGARFAFAVSRMVRRGDMVFRIVPAND
ncbi:MAG: collagenase [Bacteroidetes bacterium GWF2_43_63]|nr:MAG: collagenase [Bacteroidetes bacterium GWE2_42_42]OFY56237.1 MAG: collagenase [Bacteroidetes bacterium GWF2_43_63]HBG71909.1 collagenase-like protease [Bacteroidales bacterium]HCB61810.1 collagenase-like protease [Bacteroidales bacterium]HCY23832.1 collagenase-like protease [Bacteroidales bacterium]